MVSKIVPCKDGKHTLKEITRSEVNSTLGEEEVVRWCEYCGAIVVDQEIDRRLMGNFTPMKFPEIVRQLTS